jgi:hypothetical protein
VRCDTFVAEQLTCCVASVSINCASKPFNNKKNLFGCLLPLQAGVPLEGAPRPQQEMQTRREKKMFLKKSGLKGERNCAARGHGARQTTKPYDGTSQIRMVESPEPDNKYFPLTSNAIECTFDECPHRSASSVRVCASNSKMDEL